VIKARFRFEESTDRITRVDISGHADTADFGNDLVCCSVSTLLLATINALEEYAGIDTQAKVESGKTSFIVNDEDASEAAKIQSQAICHMFYMAMCGLTDEYPESVKVTVC